MWALWFPWSHWCSANLKLSLTTVNLLKTVLCAACKDERSASFVSGKLFKPSHSTESPRRWIWFCSCLAKSSRWVRLIREKSDFTSWIWWKYVKIGGTRWYLYLKQYTTYSIYSIVHRYFNCISSRFLDNSSMEICCHWPWRHFVVRSIYPTVWGAMPPTFWCVHSSKTGPTAR